MAIGRFSDTNLAKTAVLSGGTWVAALPLANMQDDSRYRGAPARCAFPADLTKSQFRLTWSDPQVLSMLVLLFHTLSYTAKYRIRAYDDADVLQMDTGWRDVNPSIFDPEDLPFGVENWFTGTLAPSELDLYPRHLWATFEEVLATELLVELDDHDNEDGYIDIGAVDAPANFSPVINFDRGRDLAVVPRDQLDEGASGRIFAEEHQPRRELTITHSMLQDTEVWRWVDAAMRARSTGRVLFIPDVDDPAALIREAYPATFGKLPGARLTYQSLNSSACTFKEILA